MRPQGANLAGPEPRCGSVVQWTTDAGAWPSIRALPTHLPRLARRGGEGESLESAKKHGIGLHRPDRPGAIRKPGAQVDAEAAVGIGRRRRVIDRRLRLAPKRYQRQLHGGSGHRGATGAGHPPQQRPAFLGRDRGASDQQHNGGSPEQKAASTRPRWHHAHRAVQRLLVRHIAARANGMRGG